MYRAVCKLWVFIIATLFAMTLFAEDKGPSIPQGKGEQCVADTDIMRRDHMDLMVHQRDDTVIKGIRSNPFSIVGCVDCHAQTDNEGKAIRVDASGQFCQSCHVYAAVEIDCFGCHAAVPDINQERAQLPTLPPWSTLYSALTVKDFSNRHHGSTAPIP